MTDEDGVLVAPARRDLDALAGIVTTWLESRMPAARSIRLRNFSYPRGAGQSHETILFDAQWSDKSGPHERGMVVRIKPTSFRVFLDDMFREQFEIMRVLHEEKTVPVAEVLWYEEDPSILGAPFFVMEKREGRVPVSVPSYMETGWVFDAAPKERALVWENGVRMLAAIQSAPLHQLGFLDRREAGDGFAQEWDRWKRFLDMLLARRPLPFFETAWARLIDTRPANRPPGLVWGDARLGNIMFGREFDVVAVMDWEQPSLGGALHDLGWWLFNDRCKIHARGGTVLEGFGDRDETIALWSQLTRIDTADIDWYEAFAGFKMSCLLVNIMDMKGETPESDDFADIWNARVAAPLIGLTPGDW